MEVRLLRLCEQTISQMSEPGKDENGSCFDCLIGEIVTPGGKNWGHLSPSQQVKKTTGSACQSK